MERIVRKAAWGYHLFTLKTGELAEKGKIAVLNTATGGCEIGKSGAGLWPIGIFQETLTGDGTKQIQVMMFDEIIAYWWDNDTTDAVDPTDIGKSCALKDATTVSMDATGRSLFGVVLAVDPNKGVLVCSTLAGIVPA